MPFITNDFVNILVDDDDYEQYSAKYEHYAIARRLFVSANTPFSYAVSVFFFLSHMKLSNILLFRIC